MARWLLAFSALIVVGAGILIAHYHALDSDLDGARDVAFGKIAPDLYRLGHTWTVVKKLLEVNVAVFLIKSGKNYILIDTGVPGANYVTILIDAVRDATKDGKLRMILLTHGHLDHVGSLPQVLEAFPSAQVAMHVLEAPYAGGGVSYGSIPSDNFAYWATRNMLPLPDIKLSLPVHRTLFLSGEEGDVSEVKGAAGQPPSWAPPAGLLEYTRVPGHAPGHLVLLHRPSGSLLAADTFMNYASGGGLFSKKAPPHITFVPPGSSYNLTQQALDCKKLATLKFTTAFPSHDHATGVEKEAVEAFAAAL